MPGLPAFAVPIAATGLQTIQLPGGGTIDVPVWVVDVVASGISVLAILVAAWITLRAAHIFVGGIVRTLFAREAAEGTSKELSAVEIKKRQDTIESLALNVLRFFVILIAALMILQTAFKLDIGPAVAGLGIVGIAVGLGTQNLVRDYLNGALILIENQYARGDVVRIAGVSGSVEDFTLRRTTLRDLDGTVHTVPNGQITTSSNLTRVWARINQDVQVVYGTDIERATEVVDRVGRELASDPDWGPRILEAPRVERVSELGEFGITLKVLGMVRASEQWAVGGELRKRLLEQFARSGIDIPQPQKVILTSPGAKGQPASEVIGLVGAEPPAPSAGPQSGDGAS